ncbi:MAG: PEP-CTERM/exosortase system-associated acyltransferase [Pseudomonadota bacterium]
MDALADNFARFFDVKPVVTDEQLRLAMELRYQVYCLETGFEDINQHPGGMERDEFDSRAVHSLLIHRASGMIAGTVRLVLPEAANPHALFPIEKHCGDAVRRPVAAALRGQVAEISRFCISKEFKRRMAESPSLWGSIDGVTEEDMSQRRLIPHITVGLFTAIVRMSAQHGIRYWYAVMEPSLLRLLTRFGIHFTLIGPAVEYHGARQPCFADADEVLTEMHRVVPPVWELITEGGRLWPGQVIQHREINSYRDAWPLPFGGPVFAKG